MIPILVAELVFVIAYKVYVTKLTFCLSPVTATVEVELYVFVQLVFLALYARTLDLK